MKQKELSGKAIALIGIGVAMLVGGMLDSEALFPGDVQRTMVWHLATLGTNVMVCVLIFMWYREDAVEVGFQRTRLWDIGIILATAVIVFPVYLFRSRMAQRRLGAFGRFSAFVFAGMLLPYTAGFVLPYVLTP